MEARPPKLEIKMIQELTFNPGGSYFAAFYFSLIPVIILMVGYLRWKRGKSKGKWDIAKKYRYLPIIIPLLLYYAIVYWWLFYDQFYRISIQSDNTWELKYAMPSRIKVISASDIVDIRAVSGDLRTYRMARILISTKEDRDFLSAQIALKDTAFYLDILNKYKSGGRQ